MTATLDFTFDDCIGGASDGGDVALVFVRGGTARLTKIVYSERTADGTTSLWRRTCDAQTGRDTEAKRVMSDIEPGTSATCRPGDDGAVCREVELRVVPTGHDPIVVRGVRRVDSATVAGQLGGVRAPIAKITVASQTDERPYQVDFSAETSSDPDGTILCYQWVFTTVAEGRGDPSPQYVTTEVPDPGRDPSLGSPCPDRAAPVAETGGNHGPSGDLRRQLRSLPTSGVYFVELIVTDDDGVSSTTYKRFEIEPRDPVATARVTPVAGGTGTAGQTLFEFAAEWLEDGVQAGTRHPDGDIVEYRWTLSGANMSFAAVRTTAAAWYTALPQEVVGSVSVTLTVTDDEGRTSTATTGISLEAPDPVAYPSPDTVWAVGPQPGVANVRLGGASGTADGAQLVWDPAAQVDRYVVELDAGCAPSILRTVAPSASPSMPLLPSFCDAPGNVRARVAVEVAGALSVWSPWVDATVVPHRVDPASLEAAVPPEEVGG